MTILWSKTKAELIKNFEADINKYYDILDAIKTIRLKINTKKEGKRGIPKYTDKISSIVITIPSDDSTIEIQSKSEVDMITDLTKEVRKVDPDFIFTDNGDSFHFPYLIHSAEENDSEENLILGRESSIRDYAYGLSNHCVGRLFRIIFLANVDRSIVMK